ncbi:MAG: hypothetical protein EOR51_11995 [Mesorhizobium sp.]|uniref:hypothetical protein n=1 Tax=Mesorhizobium sp. TaxID=1871066 RepID=UPI000FE991DD|nr:hypothetical protein [Mesorhizobium sp.]RWK79626.1 MAG: hypothetical protein EOR50_05725 [Mesorhizobium sp.]RWK82401.1 MAG: hypothetical protein EOR51_11995 [Mesorhizobium sp.]RWL08780.1 MAG: hypothetical protein EOR55_03555 [Mesorhizobium sp.]
MSAFFRRRVEATIEHMIGLLDEMDGDPDLEPEPIEEQHDREAVDPSFALAERSRRKRLFH